jgi:hypothetical protein
MHIDLYANELFLGHNAPIRLAAARGMRVTCTAGLVWLTVAGEAGDVFLKPGDSHVVRGRGLALLEAIGSGQVRLEQAARPWPTRAQWGRVLRHVPALPRLLALRRRLAVRAEPPAIAPVSG